MQENMHLVSDLALILISAGIMTIIFKLLKQPLVLGYIVAGFIVGPHLDIFPTVMEQTSIQEWSEIGIIFLLFALGLEFSFKKLLKVGSTAIIAAMVEIVVMFCVGFLSGYTLGWTYMESIFLGGMLAMSSTTIIIKAFDDMNLKKEKFADITMVILVIQDIVAIVMMVLLSTVAVSQQFSGLEMLYCLAKLAFFLILWFLVGISIIPTFFRKAKKYINDETLLIIAIGLCFGMVAFANYLGFSSALGAFVMGSILSETIEGEHIEKLTKGIKDLFGAIFFVSVGMMVDPHILAEYWVLILIITFIVLVVKAFVSSAGVLIAGESMENSLKSGFSLAQIGEFAFIIASLGVTLNVMRPFIYPMIVAVSVITTFTTPYCIKLATPFYNFLNRRLPDRVKERLDEYSITDHVSKHSNSVGWKKVFTISLGQIIIFGVCCIAILFCSFKILYPWAVAEFSEIVSVGIINAVICVITLLAAAPFLFGIMHQGAKTQDVYSQIWRESKQGRVAIVVWTFMRIFWACMFVIFILSKFFKFTNWVVVLIALAIVIFISFSRKILKRYLRIKENFMHNLNAKEDNLLEK